MRKPELYLGDTTVPDPLTLVTNGRAYVCSPDASICQYVGKVKRANGHIYCAVNGGGYVNSDEWGTLVPLDNYPALLEVSKELTKMS